MRKILMTALCVILGLDTYAQLLTIRDKESDEPLEFVTVHSESPAFTASTDERGQVDVTPLKGAEAITIRLIGYQERSVSYQQLSAVEFDLYLIPSDISLGQIVISATKWSQMKREVPNRVTSIRQHEVALQNPQTAADMLSTSGEVFIQKSQMGGGSPMIRGFATNRVLLTVDGVRMNTTIFRSGNLQNVISLDPLATRSTEIIFGPGSVVYGSDAIGGVMSFYTLDPEFSISHQAYPTASAALRYGSASNEKTGHFHFNIGMKKLAFLTSVSFSDYGDLKMGSHGPDDYLRPEYVTRINGQDTVVENSDPRLQVPSGYNQLNLMQKARYRISDAWELNYGWHYSTTSDYARYDRLTRYRDGQLRSGEWYYGPQVWMMNALSAVHQAPLKVYDGMKITLSQQLFKESRHDRDYQDITKFNRMERVNVLTANLDFEKSLGNTSLYYGAEVLTNRVSSTGTDENIETGEVVPGPSRYPDGARWNSYALYASAKSRLGEDLVLQGGLRYNVVTLDAEFDTTFYPFPFTHAEMKNDALTGSVGLVYDMAHHWQVSTNLSTGFRAPNVDDVGKVFDSQPGSVVVPNPDLKPEYAYNADLTVRKTIAGRVKVDVTGFYTLLDQALVRRDFLLDGQDSIDYDGELSRVQAIQNSASAYVYGFQAGLDVQLINGWGITSRYNYQRGKEKLGDGSKAPLRHAAPWFGVTHLTYKSEKVEGDLYAVYNGTLSYESMAPEEQGKDYLYALDANGNPYAPAWYTLNLKVSYRLSDHLLFSGGVENITDQRYRPYSSGLTAPGRNFIVSLRASI